MFLFLVKYFSLSWTKKNYLELKMENFVKRLEKYKEKVRCLMRKTKQREPARTLTPSSTFNPTILEK